MSYLQNSVYHNLSEFCLFLRPTSPGETNVSCPLQPGSHAFGVNIQLNDDYKFGVIVPTFQVLSVDIPALELVCVTFQLTPRFGQSLTVPFSIVPLAIALLVGFATLIAAKYNPWTGMSGLLRATANFGQDPDALRLMTPGFSDIWYYIQFAVYTACLSLNYPGFYQPGLSRVAWSNLLFNTTLLHPDGNGTLPWSTVTTSLSGQFDNSPATLINIVNGSDYGLTQYAALVGIPGKDVWPTFMVWFLLALASIIILTQVVFVIYFSYRHALGKHTNDFGTLNLCFLGGMIIRIWQLFYIVIITLSCYQLVIAGQSPTFQVGLSVITLILLGLVAPLILLWVISHHEHLFADLNFLLVLGPIYNTYKEPQVLFAGVVFLIRLFQGIVIGAGQGSGIAQITLLAFLEIIFLCALNVWRPYDRRTNMNGWQTLMSCVRLLIILFLIAFIPTLAIDAGVRAWIGYTLLVLHAIVLLFVFVVNVIQTIVEVTARKAGAGEDSALREREFGLGNVFGINQLMKRGNSTHRPTDMQGYVEETQDRKTTTETLAQKRLSRNSSQGGSSGYGLMETGSYVSRASSATPGVTPMMSPYQDRRTTMSPISAHSGVYGYFPRPGMPPSNISNNGTETTTLGTTPTSAPTDPRIPAYYRQPRRSQYPISPVATRFDTTTERENLDTVVRSAFTENIDEPRRPQSRTSSPRPQSRNEQKPRPNYAVREADAFYYHRPDYSQPLNPSVSTGRRLGTGPADPTGPIAIAGSWLRGMFRGNPEKGKFEVVRGNAARTSEIPLTENEGQREDSRPSSAGRGEDVRSPLVVDPSNVRIVEEEHEDSIFQDDPPSTSRPTTSRPTSIHHPILPELNTGQHPQQPFPSILDNVPDDDLNFPPPPPKHPNRASFSSIDSNPPSIPRKSSARASPRIHSELPWSPSPADEKVKEVKTGRGVFTTESNEGSKENVAEVRDSRDWSDEE